MPSGTFIETLLSENAKRCCQASFQEFSFL
jgi:hypothetical protein